MTHRLDPADTALLIVDWQERLYAAMPEPVRAGALRQAETLLWMARELGLPVLATEQYPRGLGPTLPQLAVPEALEKLRFSAVQVEAVAAALQQAGRRQVLVTGMETHICVAQTVRDLAGLGLQPWVVADACLSRRKLDWRLGLEHMRGQGACVVSAEAALFELLGAAGTPLFKALSQRIR